MVQTLVQYITKDLRPNQVKGSTLAAVGADRGYCKGTKWLRQIGATTWSTEKRNSSMPYTYDNHPSHVKGRLAGWSSQLTDWIADPPVAG